MQWGELGGENKGRGEKGKEMRKSHFDEKKGSEMGEDDQLWMAEERSRRESDVENCRSFEIALWS